MSDDSLDAAKLKVIAEGPLEAEEDGVKYKSHSLKDLIAMDNHLSGKSAAAVENNTGLRFFWFRPPGTTSST